MLNQEQLLDYVRKAKRGDDNAKNNVFFDKERDNYPYVMFMGKRMYYPKDYKFEEKDGKNVDTVLKETLYKHTVGFYLEPGVSTTKGYLIKINLPSQAFDADGYIGAMLKVNLDVNARQVQSKS